MRIIEGKKYRNKYEEAVIERPWLRHYRSARLRSLKKENIDKGRTFNLTESDVEYIWKRDSAHMLKRPSIDRIDNSKGYSLDNCQFLELSDNIKKDLTGSKSVTAKLNEQKVREIKLKYSSGKFTQHQLANEYGVHQSVINGIMQNNYWKHVKIGVLITKRTTYWI